VTGRRLRGPTLARERQAWSANALLVGVDEVGRGPLAGPVVAAAVAFPAGARRIPGVRDSKTLSARQRAALVPRIREAAITLAVAAASVREIDRFNIRRATALAMRRAVNRAMHAPEFQARALAGGAVEYRVLLDGMPMPECGFTHEALVDGDHLCYTVAAAGIVAKEVRDTLMRRLAVRYPAFAWDSNAGYATGEHCRAIAAWGLTPHHRRSFTPVSQISLPFV
jgi:ribonuclease HII